MYIIVGLRLDGNNMDKGALMKETIEGWVISTRGYRKMR